MKKNLTKLALSGAALAAVAATLGTSTYAWYTTNPTVNANNIIGASSDTGSSSIFISLDHTNWSSSVDLASVDLSTVMVPVQYSSAGKFTKINPATGAATAADEVGTDVVEFTLYFKSSKTANPQNIYLKTFSLDNITNVIASGTDAGKAVLPAADNLLYTGEDDTNAGMDTSKSTYAVDFRKALSLGIYNAGTTGSITDENPSTGSYDKAISLSTSLASRTFKTDAAQTISTGKAHEYYDEVMENDLASDAVKTPAGDYDKGAIAICPADGTHYATVKFYVYLDGASTFCYDACQGQTFSLNLTFTSDSTAAYVKA